MNKEDLIVGDKIWVIPGFSEEALLAIKCEILFISNIGVVTDEPFGHTIKISDLFMIKSDVKKELYKRWNALRNENREVANNSVNTSIKNFRDYYIERLAENAGQPVKEYRKEHWEDKLQFKRRKKDWLNIRDIREERRAKGIMSNSQFVKLSKHLSYLLRHKPEDGGLTLDSMGACKIDDLLKSVNRDLRFKVSKKMIERLARPPKDPSRKQRFIIEGEYIRAGHGHSEGVKVSGYQEITPKGELYHGTPSYIIEKVVEGYLSRMTRNKVHLSYDEKITLEAAKRRSRKVTLLRVKVKEAIENGIKFYNSADEKVVLSDDIPPQYLEKLENEAWVPLVT